MSTELFLGRVEVLGIDGATVHVRTVLSASEVTLTAPSREAAAEISAQAAARRDEIEIAAEIYRDEAGAWIGGRVLGWRQLDDGDPLEVWSKWFKGER